MPSIAMNCQLLSIYDTTSNTNNNEKNLDHSTDSPVDRASTSSADLDIETTVIDLESEIPEQVNTTDLPPERQFFPPIIYPRFFAPNHAYAGFNNVLDNDGKRKESQPSTVVKCNGFPRFHESTGSESPEIVDNSPTAKLAKLKMAVNVVDENDEVRLDGVGSLLTQLRRAETTRNQPRLFLSDQGVPLNVSGELRVETAIENGASSFNFSSTTPSGAQTFGRISNGVPSKMIIPTRRSCTNSFMPVHEPLGPGDIPAPPPHPTNPEEIRALIRSKMYRCCRCKNRFIERNIYERHLRDNHHKDYLIYVIKQDEEMEQQRQEEMEATRIEEIQCGGFIPPASEIAAENYDISLEDIPLPGELSNGIPARFDKFGMLRQPKRPYRKKISPQCPFCDKRFRNEQSLKKHFAKKHQDAIDFVQCNFCFKCIKSEQMLATHACELVHICFECTPIRNLCTSSRLKNHRSKFHRGANSGFRCNECALKFLTPRKLRKHTKMSHVFTITYPCHFCEELFTQESAVTTHERIHTGMIGFECKICDFKSNRYIRMEEHRKEEHGYICSICQEKLSEWAEMKNHTLVKHGGYLTSENNASYIESPRVWVMWKGEW